MNIGEIIHKLRKDKKMTLAELSAASGVALATLSRMENGKMTGTLDSHISIAKALEISLPDLYSSLALSKREVERRTKETKTDVLRHTKSSSVEMLVSKTANKKMMPLLVKIHKGGTTQKEETKTGVEKFIYVLEGNLEATIGEERYNLARGDTLYFESAIPHYFTNTGRGDARIICVACPPLL
ncbi:MAG: XRE family transcriptional regulator [Candidatus Omnitrophota bacterium]